MAKTYQEVEALAHAAAAEITKSPDRWMVFLDTAARMYRYSFQEQMLIHAQRPDATACASFDLWRQRFNRAVMRGHKGIALIDETASRPKLKYVFDVSDTVKRYGGKDPTLWSIPPAPEYEMVRRLADRFQTEPDELTLDSLLHTLAVEGTVDVLDETVEELWERVHNSFLEGLDGENLSTRLHFTMDTSLEYIFLARCGFNPRDYFGVEDFEYITEFNTLDALTVLGNAMSEQANSVLTAIGQMTRQMRREYAQQQKLGVDKTNPDDYYTLKRKSEEDLNQNQGGQNHGTDLPRGNGRDAVPGSEDEGAGGLRAGQVREPAVELPENPEAGAVSDHADEGRAVEPSGGRGQAWLGDGGTDREPDGGAERGEREPESQQPDGVAAADEQLHPVGTGDGDERAGVHLTEPVPEEQPNIPDTRPDGTELSGLFVPSEAVDAVLRTGGNRRHGVLRIIAYHQLQGVDFASFLRSEFCGDGMRDGGRGVIVDGQRYAAWFDIDGIRISRGTTVQSPDAALFTWEQAANRIASLLNRGLYQPEVVVTQAVSHERLECAEGMGFTGGNILEPAMGVGNFFGMLPDSLSQSKLYGVELDEITGKIAKQLYQKANISVTGFEKTGFSNDFFDVVIGNVPFGNYQVADKQYDRHHFMIHDYFLAKSMDKLRPGGVLAVITSSGTLDKKDDSARRYLAERADLLGAVRLPNNAFSRNAGTDVVTDILFLQKRETPRVQMPEWVSLGENQQGFTTNRYFVEHPDMVLGEWSEESTQYGRMEATVKPIEGADLGAQLHEAIGKIQGHIELTLQEDEELTEEPEMIPADPAVRNFSYAVVGGSIYFRENSVMRRLNLAEGTAQRVRGMVAIRDCARELIDAQLENASDSEIQALQRTLNDYYDRFTKRFGLISSSANRRAFANDNSYCLLRSLEVLDNEGNLVRKADMFSKRTIQRSHTVDHVDTASEALAVSIADKAAVDLDYMAQLTGSSVEDVVKELRGVIFCDPVTQKWMAADEYLSGNVREKLRTAELFAQSHDDYLPNVEALKQVQPKDLTASEISVRLGAAWIDPKYIQAFMGELLHTPFYLLGRTIQVHYSKASGTWAVSGKNADSFRNVYANKVYGTEHVNGYRLLEDCLNLRDTRILKKVYIDGQERTEVDTKATMLAQQKQDAIREQFKDWVFRDPQRRAVLVKEYNERFNSIRPRQYDGRHIRFDGMNPEIQLREHQLNAVAHVLYGPNTLLAHCVGAGKTFEMAAAAMESKRLGLCQKSLFVVPNHLVDVRCS